MRRRDVLLAALGLAAISGPAAAAGKGKPVEFYAPLPSIVLEFWDQAGLFHMVNFDLTLVTSQQGVKASKRFADALSQELSAMPWEEFKDGNPAIRIKDAALQLVKADPQLAPVTTDVLIIRLLLR